MSNVKLLLAVVAVALTSAAVPIAQGTSDSIPSRLTAVERKVTTLRRDLTTTQRALAGLVGCLGDPVPVTIYGGNPTEGYLYRNTAENREFLTSALDVTEQGDQPNAILATLKTECVTAALARTPSAASDRAGTARVIRALRLKTR